MRTTLVYDKVEQNPSDEVPETPRRVNKARYTNYYAAAVGFTLGLTFSFLLFLAVHSTNVSCIKETHFWSPALESYEDDESMELQRFNGALRMSNQFRGPPSQEIDNAWEAITYPDGGLVRLSKDEVAKIKASDFAAQYTEEMGGGYIAGIEFLHQLHCVNMLRQATYMDYYSKKNEEWKDQETLRYHIDHCIDMLRQKLMCDPDVGMVTYVWAKGWKQAFPDFNTLHKCRPYDKILNWAHENSVHGRNVSDIIRVPGAPERETRP